MLLEIEDIHTYYGRSYILQGVSLAVDKGEIVCLLGRNGAGKTTTLRSVVGLTPPRRGRIGYQGLQINGLRPFQVIRHGIAFVPEDRRIFSDLTVEENLRIAARDKADGQDWTLEKLYKFFPRLRERTTQKGNSLSGGEQQMLAIARALMGNPHLLILDEPSQGLAPLLVRTVEEIIRQIRDEGVTVLLVEQNLRMALNVADRHYVLNDGQIVYEATTQELQENEAVKKRYLGV